MNTPGFGPLWLTRTVVLAVACTGLSWAGHSIYAQGSASLGGFVFATLLTAAALARFTRSQRGATEILGVLVLAQVGFHFVFEATSTTTPVASAPVASAPELAHHGAHSSYAPGMLIGHLWAALITAAVLSYGESLLWTLTALLGQALPRLLRIPNLLPPGRYVPVPYPPTIRPRSARLLLGYPRGPPRLRYRKPLHTKPDTP